MLGLLTLVACALGSAATSLLVAWLCAISLHGCVQPCKPCFPLTQAVRETATRSERWHLGAYSATRLQPFSGVKGGSGQNKGVYTFIYIDRNCLDAFLVLQEHCGESLARPRCPGLPDPAVRHSEVMEQPLYLKLCNGSPKKRLGRSATYRIYYMFLVKGTQDLKLCQERRAVEVMPVA